MTTITDRVAERTRHHMSTQQLRQADLAFQLNLPQSAVSARLAGRVPFKLAEVEKVAAWLGVPLSELVPYEDVQP